MITNYNDYKEYLKADLRNSNVKYPRFMPIRIIKSWIAPNWIGSFLKIYRKTEYLSNCKSADSFFSKLILLIYRIKLRRMQLKLGFSFPLNVFGKGLSIPHYGNIIVNPACKIGDNCRIHVGVNIGASGGSLKAPILGDNVYIGPGAIIFGDIQIADNVSIGANATVTKSFNEKNVVIAGTPASVKKTNVKSWNGIFGVHSQD